jgi:hypothetical protein
MQAQLRTVLRAVILVNEAGAGKTFAMFGNVLADLERAEADESTGPFLPMLRRSRNVAMV